MQEFIFDKIPEDLLTSPIVRKLTTIHEHRGKQTLYLKAKPDILETFCKSARILSVDASNRIEGISTSRKRLGQIMAETTQPKNHDEEKIAGYRDVLSLIHESHDYIDVTPGIILQLHSMLHRYSGYSFAGHWKDSDNSIIERDVDGTERIRFRPLPAVAVPDAMEKLCANYNAAIVSEAADPLILASKFTFDFVSIHPFADGNGRMSRLLTLLLLYRSGFVVGKYVSIEDEINRSKETYYEALQASSVGWNEGENTYAPFVDYMLGVVLAAYKNFEAKVEGLLSPSRKSKPERVEAVLARNLGKVTKRDIIMECPDISVITIERALKSLLDDGRIEKVGRGSATGYIWRG